jgi:nucleotide-binding universal stress UspA family protein
MKILLPIDESPCSATAIDAVIRDFDPASTEIRVVHAVERSGSVPAYLAFAEGPTAADDVLESYAGERQQQEAETMRAVERLRAAGFKVTVDVRVGGPVGIILDCAADWQPDVIVMGSHGRTGVPRMVFGSLARDVSRAASCRVEVVPPPSRYTVH